MSTVAPRSPASTHIEALVAQLAALEVRDSMRDERVRLLEEENRWLKAQLFGRSSEKMPVEERNPDQAWHEIEVLAALAPDAPETITIPAYERAKRGRKKLSADIPRVEVIHDLSDADKICPNDGTALERIGQETSEQLEVIPAQIRVLQAMDGGERDQRLWFIVDELDALGTIDGLKDALARLRKFGGRCVLGFQSIAQVSSTYGHGEAQTIVENCGNTLILRCSGSEGGGTSRFASRLIGDREVVRMQQSRSRHSRDFRSSVTSSEHHATEAAVMPSEIEQLPDLQGYLKLASSPSWRRMNVSMHSPRKP